VFARKLVVASAGLEQLHEHRLLFLHRLDRVEGCDGVGSSGWVAQVLPVRHQYRTLSLYLVLFELPHQEILVTVVVTSIYKV
jgi:hypothetical protein